MAMSGRSSVFKVAVQLFSRLLILYYRLRWPDAEFGRNILFGGFPLIKLANGASLTVGDNVGFISMTAGNYAGLTKRCTLYVGENASLRIGSNTWFSGVSIYCTTKIDIGSYVMCGANTQIWDTHYHPLEWRARREHERSQIEAGPIVIGDDVFLGGGVTILKGVTIGSRSVIGAGSVVAKNIPADEVWAGNRARFVKRAPTYG